MVDKIREHDKMFVKFITRKVLKPTIDCLLKGEGTANLLKTPPEKTIRRSSVKSSEHHKCDMCHIRFGNEHGLRIHKGKMHSEKKRKHLENENDMVKYKVCIYIGASTEELKAHVLIVHSDPCFKCVNCNYTGVSTVEVKNHMLVMHCESVIGKSHNIEEATPSVELRRDKKSVRFVTIRIWMIMI